MPKIVVAKGLCTPVRSAVTKVLKPYGVRFSIHSYSDGPGPVQTPENTPGACMNIAEVTVSDAAATWAEYLLCRSDLFWLLSKPIDKRNVKWAAKWNGEMPEPWVEAGCKVTQAADYGNSIVTHAHDRKMTQATQTGKAKRKERY